MKHIFSSLILISMISCHINGSFRHTALKNGAKLYTLRNCSTTQKLTPEQLTHIKGLLKASEERIINDIERITKTAEKINGEALTLPDVYDLLPEEEVNYLKKFLGN